MKITREQQRLWGACYTDEKIAALVQADGLTPLEIAKLDIPAEDRLWLLLREEIIPARELRLLACDWAEKACEKTGWTDERSLYATAIARRFVAGNATEAELAEARSEAYAATLGSAQAAQWSAAAAAWSTAVSDAAEAAAWSASDAAEAAEEASDAVEAAEEARSAQLADVVQVIERLNEAEQAGKGAK